MFTNTNMLPGKILIQIRSKKEECQLAICMYSVHELLLSGPVSLVLCLDEMNHVVMSHWYLSAWSMPLWVAQTGFSDGDMSIFLSGSS